ncbi:MAG: alpha/beta hydrolase, partial [Bacteroidales bacterium]|nr:alpha/beta hydrolase [Bacteroidales bacterium]
MRIFSIIAFTAISYLLSAQTYTPDSILVKFKLGYFYNQGKTDSKEPGVKKRGKGYQLGKYEIGAHEKIAFQIISGKCEKITLHSISKYDAWATVYDGAPKDLSFEQYFRKNVKNDNIVGYYLTVNGAHEQYSTTACEILVNKFHWEKPQARHYKIELEKVNYISYNSESYTGVGMDGVSTLKIDIDLPGRKELYISEPKIGRLQYGKKESRAIYDKQSREEKLGISNIVKLVDGVATITYIPPDNMTLEEQGKHLYQYVYGTFIPSPRFYDDRSMAVFDSIYCQYIDFDGENKIIGIGIEIVRPPLLFVHGFLGNRETWKEMERKFNSYGFKTHRRQYHAGLEKSINDQSDVLADHIKSALKGLGRDIKIQKADLVCHSMGGLIARGYVQDKDNYRNNVRKLITVGTPHRGVGSPGYYMGKMGSFWTQEHKKAIEQLHESSNFIEELNKGYHNGSHMVKGIEYGNIYVHPTDLVVPASSANLNFAKSYVLPGGYRHSAEIPGVASITNDELVAKVLLKWLTGEKIPRAPNSYIHIELSKASSGKIFIKSLNSENLPLLRRNTKSERPKLIKQYSGVMTLDGKAVIHFKMEKKIWGSIYLHDSSEIYIGNCSPEMMNVRLIKGKALFRSSASESGHFMVDIDTLSPLYNKSGWFKFNPFSSARGLQTEFIIEFDGKKALVKSLEGNIELSHMGEPPGKEILINDSRAFEISGNISTEINYQGKKWWIDLNEIMGDEDGKSSLIEDGTEEEQASLGDDDTFYT